MTPKTPTASGISRLLATAGFERADKPVRGGICRGYRVGKDYRHADAVNVRWSMRATPEQHAAQLAKYAKTLTEAGWTVEAHAYELIVTAKPEDSSLAAKDGDPPMTVVIIPCPECGHGLPDPLAALRAEITRDAATEQELGDDYSDMGTDPSWDSANKHWGRAEALREVLATMDRLEEKE